MRRIAFDWISGVTRREEAAQVAQAVATNCVCMCVCIWKGEKRDQFEGNGKVCVCKKNCERVRVMCPERVCVRKISFRYLTNDHKNECGLTDDREKSGEND